MKKSSLFLLLCSALLWAGTQNDIESNSIISKQENQLRIAPLSGGIHVESLIKGSEIRANVIDGRGRLVQQLEGVDGLDFNFDTVSPGVYFMKIENNSRIQSVKIQIP